MRTRVHKKRTFGQDRYLPSLRPPDALASKPAARLLRRLATYPSAITDRQLASAAGVHHSVAHQVLERLTQEGVLDRFGSGLIRRRVRRKWTPRGLGKGLGAGERAAVALFLQARADFIVTDDRAFLRALREAGLPHATSALAVVELARSGAVTLQDAAAGLEQLRPMIRQDQYEAAQADLVALAARQGG